MKPQNSVKVAGALVEILALIQKQPSAYLGTTANKYSALVGFMSGFSSGAKYASEDMATTSFPLEFDKFVKDQVNAKCKFLKYHEHDHWVDILLRESRNDENEAFDQFYTHLEAWKKDHTLRQ